jgi:hypothetical protein
MATESGPYSASSASATSMSFVLRRVKRMHVGVKNSAPRRRRRTERATATNGEDRDRLLTLARPVWNRGSERHIGRQDIFPDRAGRQLRDRTSRNRKRRSRVRPLMASSRRALTIVDRAGYAAFFAFLCSRYFRILLLATSLCFAHTIPKTGAAGFLHPGTGQS